MQELEIKIHDYALEEIMGTRYGRYAKTIIQDRAIPDVRDGLKPVQRRILYGMYEDNNTSDKPYRKSAKTVGNIMGKYHPHGDSSIYDALVRMSQWWKQNTPYIDMQGNNGSMDGDNAAAMRYTEARLAKISIELLKDIDKDTVLWAPTYDDTDKEPTVLPAKFPNLLVGGTSGISAGYATSIPPHNLGEVIEATIKRIDSPNCHLDTILSIVEGPDFPTGGIVEGKNGIIDAFTTGRGRVIVRAKTEIIKTKGKEQIIVTEIPYDVNKATLVRKIDEIRIDKKIEGIAEVRDETDREGLRIAIDLKKDVNCDLILNYLLKNSELQISYNYNMVAIVNRRPMTLGIMAILDAYIAHQREVITNRTRFNLRHAEKDIHIVEGLIKMLSILDEVIAAIRKSKNKADAQVNLCQQFAFTELQAKAIVEMQLYRLTNTDVVELEERHKNLLLIIEGLKAILEDEERLKGVMKDELKKIKKDYATPRKTEIRDEITEIKIDTINLIPKEDNMVAVTYEGYTKRVSLRSYNKDEQTLLKEGDYLSYLYKMSTLDTLLLFTNKGNYLYIPVHELPELKWKELGKHASNIVPIAADERIIAALPISDFKETETITIFTKNGMVKRTSLAEFKVTRYSKPITCMKLKEQDTVVAVTNSSGANILITTRNGFGLLYNKTEVALIGLRASGVKAISLKNDEVVSAHIYDEAEYLSLITDKGTGKRIRLNDFERTSRARKGVRVIRDVKTNPYYVVRSFVLPASQTLALKIGDDYQGVKITELKLADRYSTGNQLTKSKIADVMVQVVVDDNKTREVVSEREDVNLSLIDEQIMTIDDFLDDFNV